MIKALFLFTWFFFLITYVNVTWAHNTKWRHITLTRLMTSASSMWSMQARKISCPNNLTSKKGSYLNDKRILLSLTVLRFSRHALRSKRDDENYRFHGRCKMHLPKYYFPCSIVKSEKREKKEDDTFVLKWRPLQAKRQFHFVLRI